MTRSFEIGDRIIAIRSFAAVEKGDIGIIVKNHWNDDLFYKISKQYKSIKKSIKLLCFLYCLD